MVKDALSELVETIYAIAETAGIAIIQYLAENQTLNINRKPDHSFVTVLDTLANAIIIEALKNISSYPIVSEESSLPPYTERAHWSYYWLVDPLDGTRDLIEGTGDYTVNIALIQNNRPVLGVVYVPHQQKGFLATHKGGAYLIQNKHRTLVHTRSFNPAQWTLALSRFHTTLEMHAKLANLPGVTLKILGSSLKICEIATGEIDCYPRMGPTHEWDLAAAQIILEEAGGALLDLSLKNLSYNTKESLLQPYFIAIGDKTVDWNTLIASL